MLKKLTTEKSSKTQLNSPEMAELKGGGIFDTFICLSRMYMWLQDCDNWEPQMQEMYENERNNA